MHRRMALLIVSALLLAACSGGDGSVPTGAAVEGPLVERPDGSFVSPDFTVNLADGTTWSLAEQTTPTLLVFWADWCTVCRAELPALDAVAADYDGRLGILAVAGMGSPDRAADAADDWLGSGAIDWGYDDGGELWALFGVRGTPTSVVLAADGQVLAVQPGALPADKRAVLDEVVAVGS